MTIRMNVKNTIITLAISVIMSAMSVLYMRHYAMSLSPDRVATWASLATFGCLICALTGFALGHYGARERIQGIKQGTDIMAESAGKVLDVRRSMPIPPSVVVQQSAQPADDIIIRPATPARTSAKSSIDIVDMG